MTQQATAGNTVRVHYVGTLDNGDRFDTSVGGDPLEFTLGSGQVIPGFDEAISGMEVGETKQVRIPAEQAYGPYREEMILELPREQLPADAQLQVGQQVQMQQGEHVFVVRVEEIGENSVTFNANHPLAGEALNFDLRLVEIR
ncbi:MAG: FKBP-type peptidyl-prolyl cis-trans isomerase [Caldilineaceae bacterium]